MALHVALRRCRTRCCLPIHRHRRWSRTALLTITLALSVVLRSIDASNVGRIFVVASNFTSLNFISTAHAPAGQGRVPGRWIAAFKDLGHFPTTLHAPQVQFYSQFKRCAQTINKCC
jgi:hypothetical protein